MTEKVLILDHVSKKFSDKYVLKDINFSIKKGEFISVIGKSGSGKSTILRLVSGLEGLTEGAMTIDGEEIHGINKKIRMMFQDGRLLPWKTVLDNLMIGLEKADRNEAQELLAQVGLADFSERYPSQLSGGQQQRVALARALLHKPTLLLLDEPLGALDAFTRQEMQDLIVNICHKHNITALFVTHDIEEAIYLADRVIILGEGVITEDLAVGLPFPRQKTDPKIQEHVTHLMDIFSHSANTAVDIDVE